jgi:hypothetical protein
MDATDNGAGMDTQRLMFMALLLSWIGASVVPTSAMCPGSVTLDDQFAHSQTVFVGRAVAQQIVPTGSRSETRATETTFEVGEFWKGQKNPTIRIRTCGWIDGSMAMTCSEDVTFHVGLRYVVFASGDPLETNSCFPTGLVDRSEKTLQWLSGKPRK